MKRILLLLVLMILVTPFSAATSSIDTRRMNNIVNRTDDDYDPLVDISVTVEIKTIRFLEDKTTQSYTLNLEHPKNQGILFREMMQWQLNKNRISEDKPNLFVKIFINSEEFISPMYYDTYYEYNPDFSATLNVPDNEECVDIIIQLWDENSNTPLDINPVAGEHIAHMVYSIKTGHWTGDDYHGDPSGYGRLNGCDDGSIYEREQDCELWFDIYQNDYDGDEIPYWAEVNILGTDPTVDDTFSDPDNDGIPTYWEWKWGYDPLSWDDHKNIDTDGDSLSNYEEYLTSEWLSDPYRKDVFVEMDKMDDGPNGEKTYFPVGAKELIQTSFNRQNIVFHLDMGEMSGYDLVPFDGDIGRNDLRDFYFNYFLHGDENNWRRGVFHYGLVIYYEDVPGYMFRSNAYQIASAGMEDKVKKFPWLDREIVYASAYMHELGHTFAFNPIPGHNGNSKYPWQVGYWINHPYKSCMNYGWMYKIVDYSDGSRGSPDIDDWNRIDYDYFEREWI